MIQRFFVCFHFRLLIESRHMIAYEGSESAWNLYGPEETVQATIDDRYSIRAIFPVHNILKLEKENGINLTQMQKHNDELHELARS